MAFRGKLYRGIRGEFDYKVGAHIVWPAFTSCSMDEKQALSYMEKGTLFEIELKEHYGCFVSEYSKFPMEAEVLPPPFTSFKVTDVTIDERGFS